MIPVDWNKRVEDAKVDVGLFKEMEQEALQALVKASQQAAMRPGDQSAADALERETQRFCEVTKGRIAAEARLSTETVMRDHGWFS